MLCTFLPAVSRSRGRATSGWAAIRSGPVQAWPCLKFPPLAPMATIAGAMPSGALGASSASIKRSQARADAKREAKEARDMEQEKRRTRQQYEQSWRESIYAQYRVDAAKDLQVHTLSYRHHATSV